MIVYLLDLLLYFINFKTLIWITILLASIFYCIISQMEGYVYSIDSKIAASEVQKTKVTENSSFSRIRQNTYDVIISIENGFTIKGKFIKQVNSKDWKTIMYFLPYKGSYEECESHIHALWNKLGVNIAVFNYRDVPGEPSGEYDTIDHMTEEYFKGDSQNELNWVYSNQYINNSEIYLYGRSLGGAIALYLGSTQKEYIE